jgi:hypothetical protein
MLTTATLTTRGLFRDAHWPGTYLQGEMLNIGLELHYEVSYIEGPSGGGVFTFPATTLHLVELGVPVYDEEGVFTGFAPPSTEDEIQAFVPTLMWSQWMADDAPFVLRTLYTWNFAATPGVVATPDVGTTSKITRSAVIISSSTSTPPFGSEYGLGIGTARWLMLRVPTLTLTPPAGFGGFRSQIDLRPRHGTSDDMLMVVRDPHEVLEEP